MVSGRRWIKLRMSWQLLPCLPASIVFECAMYTDKGEKPKCSYPAVALSCYNNQAAKQNVLPGTGTAVTETTKDFLISCMFHTLMPATGNLVKSPWLVRSCDL